MKYLIAIYLFTTIFLLPAQKQDAAAMGSNLASDDFQLPFNSFKIIGFGALHGAANTETTELYLLKKLIQKNQLDVYFPETDVATAYYFQTFLRTGDTVLLKELVSAYGTRIPQESSIEMFQKWKQLRLLLHGKPMLVLGVDKIINYKYSLKLLHELYNSKSSWAVLDSLNFLANDKNTSWRAFHSSDQLIRLVNTYNKNKSQYQTSIRDTFLFQHIINNIQYTFNADKREQRMYNNYLVLQKQYNLSQTKQYFRMGVFHIMKSRINNSASFFCKLLENGIYKKEDIVSIQGYLNKSRVLWDIKYKSYFNPNSYEGYKTKGRFGYSDHIFEHFKGIRKLKRLKMSDYTFYNLKSDTINSKYNRIGNLNLIKIKSLFHRVYWKPVKGKSTLDYIDYAILISNSKANTPIEELK